MSSSFRRGGKKTLSSKNRGVRPARASSPSAPFGRKTTKTSALPISGRATPSTSASASFPGSSTNTSAPSSIFERIGTKPWVGGLTLTSSGLRELDAIYGGGQPLGTAVLIEEDRWTQDLALALVRYWSAEGVAQGQCLSLLSSLQDVDDLDLATADREDGSICSGRIQFQQGMSNRGLEEFQRMLPRDLHRDKAKAKSDAATKQIEALVAAQKSGALPNVGFGTIEEQDDDDFDEAEGDQDKDGVGLGTQTSKDADEGLTNAWQYKVSVQRERLGTPLASAQSRGKDKVYCHSFDLSGKMEDQHPPSWPKENGTSIVNCITPLLSSHNERSDAMSLYSKCVQHIHDKISEQPNTVIRLLVMNAQVEVFAIALPLLLNYIRSKSLPVVILITVRPWLRSSSTIVNKSLRSLIVLRRFCDAVLACEGFAAMVAPPPSEFSDLAGILTIRKMALQSLSHFADSTTNRRPPANRYGMKRDRRKMHIRMLHLPPEDFSAGGSSVGSGARSGAGKSSKVDGMDTSGSRSVKTALQPGLACATAMKPNASSSAQSLDF